jgi:hypothetical protein
MNPTSILNVSKPFEGWKNKAEQLLYRMYPRHFDEGRFSAVHVGANNDAAPGTIGGFKLHGPQAQREALYFEPPQRMYPTQVLTSPEVLRPTAEAKVADSVAAHANNLVAQLVEGGMALKEAQVKVADSVDKFCYFDQKTGRFTIEPVAAKINDAMFDGMKIPFWNVTQIPKVYKRPYLRGEAERLVSSLGVPNVWVDAIQIFTADYEGMARVSDVAHALPEFNTSMGGAAKVGTMLSHIINLVIDYESRNPGEELVLGRNGNWLGSSVIGDIDVFADLMLDILMNTLIYFGHAESGFEGLTQIADRDGKYTQYPSNKPPASYLWENDGAGSGTGPVNTTVGADLLLMFNHMIADWLEDMFFLPVDIVVNCSPIMWKVFHWSMLSKVYNQNSPLSIINTAFESDNKIVQTVATKAGNALQHKITFCPDPMLMPNTPFNPTDEDLMFVTFPTLQSEFENNNQLTDLVTMPKLISRMILPSAPGYRSGVVRTALKRIGSLLCPVSGLVRVVTGMGTNSRYVPDGTVTPVEVVIANTTANPVPTQEVVTGP